jgi:hypothetical protein
LLEKALHASFVLRYGRVNFTVNTFEVEVGNEAWGTVAWAGDNEGIQVVLFDHAIEMNVTVS